MAFGFERIQQDQRENQRDKDLFQKYDRPAPRYTSFPVYPYWDEWVSEENWISQLQEELEERSNFSAGSSVEGEGIDLYIHIPFCESLCTFCGCNRTITKDHSHEISYVRTLLQEWEIYLRILKTANSSPIRIKSIHLGGGTPTFLQPANLRLLFQGLMDSTSSASSSSSSSPQWEGAVEIDPRVTTLDHYKVFQEFKFKKLSMGIQDFDPQVQQIIKRIQSKDKVFQQAEWAREHGFTSLNFDLVYGLPRQSLTSIQQTFATIQSLCPDTLSFYSYAHAPWKNRWQKALEKWSIPQGELKRELYEEGRRLLLAQGYLEIGMDHFALPKDQLYKAFLQKKVKRSFMGYTLQQTSFLIGLGATSISSSPMAFAQNERELTKYKEKVQEGRLPVSKGHFLSLSDRVIGKTIENILCFGKAPINEAILHLPKEFIPGLKEQLSAFLQDGLITLENGNLEVTTIGRPFIRNICMIFDFYLTPNIQQFGQSV